MTLRDALDTGRKVKIDYMPNWLDPRALSPNHAQFSYFDVMNVNWQVEDERKISLSKSQIIGALASSFAGRTFSELLTESRIADMLEKLGFK